MVDFPSIFDFLEFLGFLRGYPAAYIVLITSALILILGDWRWALLALLIQYLVVGLLFADVLVAHLAFMKVFVGAFICLILYVTARQVNWGQLPEDITEDEAILLGAQSNDIQNVLRAGPYALATRTLFRIFLAVLVALAAWMLASWTYDQIPQVPEYISLAVLALVGMGLVTFSLTSEPMKAGLGLLTFLIGFDLFYSAVEQSVAMLLMWAVADLFVVMVIAYLIQARHSYEALLD